MPCTNFLHPAQALSAGKELDWSRLNTVLNQGPDQHGVTGIKVSVQVM